MCKYNANNSFIKRISKYNINEIVNRGMGVLIVF